MRERLLAGLVGLAVVGIAVVAVAHVISVMRVVPDDLGRSLDSSTRLVAAVVAEREAGGRPVTADFLGTLVDADQHLTVERPARRRLDAGATLDPELGNLVASQALATGGTVTLTLSGAVVDDEVADRILPVAIVAVTLAGLAALAGLLLARRMSRPFRELAALADEFSRGRFDVDVPHYPVPEAAGIGAAMRMAADQVSELARREREFAANAAHQLRTPITALRLDLEDLTMWPETPPGVGAQLDRAIVEVDRLSTTVNDLLDLARGNRVGTLPDINLNALVADTVARWRPLVRAGDRRIEYDGRDAIAVRLAAGPLSQILDVLVENAVAHGAGTITVETATPDHYVRVSVRDEGHRTIGNDIFKRGLRTRAGSGEGNGLAVANEMAEALGGHLALEPDERTTFSLMLPRPSRVG